MTKLVHASDLHADIDVAEWMFEQRIHEAGHMGSDPLDLLLQREAEEIDVESDDE